MSAQKEIRHTGDTLDQEIGRRVHQIMWDRQMTQTVFAERVGMDQSSVAKRLRGKLGWSAKQVSEAAHVLNVSIAYLFGETENPHQSPDGGKLVGLAGYDPTTSTVKYGRSATIHSLTAHRTRKAS